MCLLHSQLKRSYSSIRARVDALISQRGTLEATLAQHTAALSQHNRRVEACGARIKAMEDQDAATRCACALYPQPLN